MASLKDLFTYPSNASSYYFNPTYLAGAIQATQIESGTKYIIKTVGTTDFTTVGAASNTVGLEFTASGTPTGTGTVWILASGMFARMNKLNTESDGYDYNVTYWGSTDETVMVSEVSKFINYYDQFPGDLRKLSMFDIYENPLIVFNKESYNQPVTSVEVKLLSGAGNVGGLELNVNDTSHISDGDRISLDFTPDDYDNNNSTAFDAYADVISSTKIQLYTDAGLTTAYQNAGFIDYTGNVGHFSTASGAMHIMPANTNPLTTLSDGDNILYRTVSSSTAFDRANGGDVDSIDTVHFLDRDQLNTNSGGADFVQTAHYYSDSGLSSHRTSDEEYKATLSFTIAGGTTGTTEHSVDIDVSDSSTVSFTAGNETTFSGLRTSLNNDKTKLGFAYARTYFTGGSITDNQANAVLSSSRDKDEFWFVKYDDVAETITLTKSTTASNYSSNIDVGTTTTISVEILDPFYLASDAHLVQVPEGPTGSKAYAIYHPTEGALVNKWFIGSATPIIQGNKVYSYLDAAGATAYGAILTNKYWEAGDTTVSTMTSDEQGSIQCTVNGSGYLTGFTNFGAKNNINGGIWDNNNDIMIEIDAVADLYSPRALTTAESEDVFDTQDYWVDPSFNLLKNWPTVVTPSSAKITVNQPSTVNITQSGRKFVRNSGITKWQLEVNYPAMTRYEFEEYQAVAQAVQGQNIPFYFILRNDDDEHILMSNNYTNTPGAIALVTDNTTTSGSSIVQISGFDSETTQALNKGEVIIMSGSRNGTVHTVVHDVDSNIYGEAKFRLAYPITSTLTPGKLAQKNPYHVVVTLSEDAFEYQVSTEDYYFLTVTFDLDEWK